jgi:hypothetical protein
VKTVRSGCFVWRVRCRRLWLPFRAKAPIPKNRLLMPSGAQLSSVQYHLRSECWPRLQEIGIVERGEGRERLPHLMVVCDGEGLLEGGFENYRRRAIDRR